MPAAARYCVTGDTLINTNNGLIAIQDLNNTDNMESDINCNIESINQINKAVKWFNSGEQDIISIITDLGFEISGSYNHPILTVASKFFNNINNNLTFEWKLLQDITDNDYVIINSKQNQISSTHDLLTDEEIQFLGCFLSNGKVRHKSSGYWELKFVHNNKNLLDIIINFLNKLSKQLNVISKLRIQHMKFPKNPQDRIIINSKLIFQYLHDNYELQRSSQIRVVPKKILQSSLQTQAKFLAYIFDCKCEINLFNDKKEGKKPQFIFNSLSKQFIQQIQIMLLQFGIISYTYEMPNKKKKVFKLKIKDYSSFVNYQKYINFISKSKIKILNSIIDFLSLSHEYIQNDYTIAKVVNVQKLYKKQCVYSIKVDSECHSFTANGFFNHNTEAKLNKLAEFNMNGIQNEAVEFKPNYSETELEPNILPSVFPHILCNPTSGIAVGYTCNFPANNLNEICNAIIAYIKDNNITIEQLMQLIPGPDFPSGAQLINNEEIKKLYETGVGKLTFKAKYHIDDNNIIITELPPEVNRDKLVEKINKLCFEEKKIPRVNTIRDLSTNSTNIRIELQKSAILDIILKALFEQTELTKNCSYIMRAIKNNTPKVFSLKELIQEYVIHRKNCIIQENKYLLTKVQKKLHLQQGLLLVVNTLSKAIQIIEQADNDKLAKVELMKYFQIDDEQVETVLDFKLRKLTKLDKNDIINNIQYLQNEITNRTNLLNNDNLINNFIINQLHELQKQFGDSRRTEIINVNNQIQEQEIYNTILILTNKNTIKILSEDSYNNILKTNVLKEKQEIYKKKIICTNQDLFLLILENGEYVKLTFNDLLSWNSKINIINLYKLNNEILEDNNKYILCITVTGLIIKIKVNGFKARLKKLSSIFKQDTTILYSELITSDKNNIITFVTSNGMIHRCFEQSFKEVLSASKNGVSSINLKENDKLIAASVNQYNENDKIILYTKHNNSFGYKMLENNIVPIKSRSGKGASYITFSKRDPGEVYNILIINNNFINLDNRGKIHMIQLDKLELGNKLSKPIKINYEPIIYNFIK